MAEQQLRGGNIKQARQLLQDIQTQSPEQKLSGFFRFLHGEVALGDGQYEQAIRDYHLVLRLEQWSGFHNRAMLGLMKCHRELNQFDEAKRWLDSIEQSYPDFYKQQNLDKQRKLNDTLEKQWQQAQKEGADRKDAFATNFEADDPDFGSLPVMQSLGIVGPHTSHAEFAGSTHSVGYTKQLENVRPNGYYWVSFWYRTQLGPEHYSVQPSMECQFWGADKERSSDWRNWVAMWRTYGQWKRGGGLVQAPEETKGHITIQFQNMHGLFECDGINIQPVDAKTLHSLRQFREGEVTP